MNVKGTKNIIEQCMRHQVKRLVYVSSVHAIPETDEKATISETTKFSKDTVIGAYAATKAEATQAVLDAVKNGLDAVVVHPSGIVGPYDSGNNHIVQLRAKSQRNRIYCCASLYGNMEYSAGIRK